MARPGFRQHPKFKRLVHILREPVPHAWGYLECLWDVAYQNGDALIGDSTDMELAAEYPGEPGKLVKALLAVRLVDEVAPGKFAVHDLEENAPEFVKSRMRMRRYRARARTGDAPTDYHTPTELRNSSSPLRNGYDSNSTAQPSTAQHSTAQHSTGKPPKAPRKRGSGGGEVIAPGFVDFWQSYPRKTAKAGAIKAWNKLAPDEPLRKLILAALDRQKQSPQWTKDNGQFIPHPATWLNGRRWEDAEEMSAADADAARFKRFVEGETADVFQAPLDPRLKRFVEDHQ